MLKLKLWYGCTPHPVKPKIMSHGLEKPSYSILYNPAMTIGKNIVANVSPTRGSYIYIVIIVCDVKNKIADIKRCIFILYNIF